MKSSSLVLVGLLLCTLFTGINAIRRYKSPLLSTATTESSVVNPPEQWLNQKLDHSQPLDKRTWQQRFFVMNHWFNPTANPLIILDICGEGECNNVQYNSSFESSIAQNFNGIVFSLEHRFYGKSQPFGKTANSYSLENLKYLTADQALDDLASFIQFAKSTNLFGITPNMPWVTIGGSYPGALSAWFRYKFPHLTIGALASSAVVNSIADFNLFDAQISASLLKQTTNTDCRQVVHDVNVNVTNIFQKGNAEETAAIKKIFTDDTTVSDGDFLFYFSDITVMGVQYGDREQMCQLITQDLTFEGVLNNIKFYSHRVGVTIDMYAVESLRQTTYGQELNARQWYYQVIIGMDEQGYLCSFKRNIQNQFLNTFAFNQVCSEFGWLFTPAHEYPMRSTMLDMNYWRQWCNLAYDGAFPDDAQTNNYYGGLDLQATNLIFTNGGEDPWQWASKRTPSKGIQSYIADCDQCAHCVDLGTPSPNDSLLLKAIRSQVIRSFSNWINEFYAQNNNETPSFIEEILNSMK